jgi:hypothetical protein
MKRADAVRTCRIFLPRTRNRAMKELGDLILAAIEHKVIAAKPPMLHYPFYRAQGWYFDFAWPGQMVAADVGNFSIFTSTDKWDHASSTGWRVFRFSPREVRDGKAVETLARALAHPALFR